MAITSYATLQDAILAYANKQDIAQSLDTFIALAEADMQRKVRHWRMERRSTALLDTQYTALPTDFLEPIRAMLTGTDPLHLEVIGVGELAERREAAKDASAKPKYYAIVDGTIEVFPQPDADYTFELVYYSDIPALNDANTSNWVLEKHQDAYLFGALMQTAPFLGDDGRLAVWTSLYQSAIDGINAESEKAKTAGAGRRIQIRSY